MIELGGLAFEIFFLFSLFFDGGPGIRVLVRVRFEQSIAELLAAHGLLSTPEVSHTYHFIPSEFETGASFREYIHNALGQYQIVLALRLLEANGLTGREDLEKFQKTLEAWGSFNHFSSVVINEKDILDYLEANDESGSED